MSTLQDADARLRAARATLDRAEMGRRSTPDLIAALRLALDIAALQRDVERRRERRERQALVERRTPTWPPRVTLASSTSRPGEGVAQ